MSRGMSLISGVIFLAITIAVTVLIYEAGMPAIQKMQAASVIEKMKDTFTELDKIIRKVASEGKYSKRTVYLRVDPGRLTVNETTDSIYWEVETDTPVISSGTSQRFGNVIIGANLEASAYEGTYEGTDAYILENEYLRVYIKKIGSSGSYASYSTSDILLAVYNKDTKNWLDLHSLQISIDNKVTSMSGNGYTAMLDSGYNLPYAAAFARMNSSYIDYYINFTLTSGADFIEIEANKV